MSRRDARTHTHAHTHAHTHTHSHTHTHTLTHTHTHITFFFPYTRTLRRGGVLVWKLGTVSKQTSGRRDRMSFDVCFPQCITDGAPLVSTRPELESHQKSSDSRSVSFVRPQTPSEYTNTQDTTRVKLSRWCRFHSVQISVHKFSSVQFRSKCGYLMSRAYVSRHMLRCSLFALPSNTIWADASRWKLADLAIWPPCAK